MIIQIHNVILPIYLPSFLPTYLPTYLPHLHIFLHNYLPSVWWNTSPSTWSMEISLSSSRSLHCRSDQPTQRSFQHCISSVLIPYVYASFSGVRQINCVNHSVYNNICMHVCMCAYAYLCMSVIQLNGVNHSEYSYVCMHECMYLCTYVYMYVRMHMYTNLI